MRRTDGFTLIELLVVVGILSILMAIAIAQVFRARARSNEISSVASMRAILSGQEAFVASCGWGGYATDLSDLARPTPGGSAFLSPDLAINGGSKSGYLFSLAKNAGAGVADVVIPSCNGAASPRATSYFLSVVPSAIGTTGTRYFATDTGGTIFMSSAAPIANPIPPGSTFLQ
jgi:prepilin-type N-terminal cleavage/methylation domain-containing protein